MRETLLIQLTADPANDCSWVIVGEDGQVVGFPQTGPLSQAQQKTAGRAIVVLAPGEKVLFTRTNVPTQKRQRLLRAIPYAIEDQLADDVEDLHFAIGEREESGDIPVAVVARADLESWLARLHAAQLTPDALIPDYCLIPTRDGGWNIAFDGDRVLFRAGHHAPMFIDRDAVPIVLRNFLAREEEPPECINVYACEGRVRDMQVIAGEVPVTERQCDDGILPLLARNFRKATSIDLLQGEFSQTEKLAQAIRPWRFTAALLVAAIGLVFASNVVKMVNLESVKADLDGQIEALYKKTFPDAKRIVNPRLQMEQRIREMRAAQGGGTDGFLTLLANSGQIIRRQRGVDIDGISYRDGNLDLELLVGSLQTLDALKAALAADGRMEVDIQSAVAGADGKVQSRLRLRGKRS